MNRVAACLISLFAAMAWVIASGHAAAFNTPTQILTVVEYRNGFLGHYFLTGDPQEMAAIDAGAAGPGWERTGQAFTAISMPGNGLGACTGCLPARRYYAPGPNSHFFTLEREESSLLDRPGNGWGFEKIAFYAYAPAQAGCPSEGRYPVYRLYNNRWMFNDSNHRYVTNESERERMHAAGWIDEGAHMCVLDSPLRSIAMMVPAEGPVLPDDECRDPGLGEGACLSTSNLALPASPFTIEPAERAAFSQLSGVGISTQYSDLDVYRGLSSLAPPLNADLLLQHSFATLAGTVIALHLDARDRIANGAATLGPVSRLATIPGPMGDDRRLFPFRVGTVPAELSIQLSLRVARVATREPAGKASGHTAVEFLDTGSRGRVLFTVLAFGNEDGDGTTFDDGTATARVHTTARESTPYGRAIGVTLRTPLGHEELMLGGFDFRMDRAAFGRVLASARSVSPGLSEEPSDYLVTRFAFENRVEGEAEIGMAVTSYNLRLMPQR